MSFLKISDFIEEGQDALKNSKYWCALAIALMLPSMCSRIAFDGNSDYIKENNTPKDKRCYVDWCQNYLLGYYFKECLGDNYAEELYNLRCDIIHAGCADMHADGKKAFFLLGKNLGSVELGDYKVIDINTFCDAIFNSVNLWYAEAKFRDKKFTRVFCQDNRDDMLLYNELCNRARAKFLLQEFDEENKDEQDKKG